MAHSAGRRGPNGGAGSATPFVPKSLVTGGQGDGDGTGYEIAALEAEVAGIDDPWDQLETILTRSLTGYEPEAPDAGRLWIESWHFGIRDPEMRADALRDNTAWRRLVAGVVQRGIERGMFTDRYDAEMVAVLAVAAADGMGIPLSLGDPDITAASAVHNVMATLRELLRN